MGMFRLTVKLTIIHAQGWQYQNHEQTFKCMKNIRIIIGYVINGKNDIDDLLVVRAQ